MIRKTMEVRIFTDKFATDERGEYDNQVLQVLISENTHIGQARYVFEMSVAEANELWGKLGYALRRVGVLETKSRSAMTFAEREDHRKRGCPDPLCEICHPKDDHE